MSEIEKMKRYIERTKATNMDAYHIMVSKIKW